MIELSLVFGIIGFLLTAYSIIANDSMQTLGTFIASNKKVKWQYLWLAASSVLIATIVYSFMQYGGDISYGRLEKIPYIEIQWFHLLPPIFLVVLTKYGIPISTSLLIFSVFASELVFEKVLVKSFLGYGLAFSIGYSVWFIFMKFFQGFYKKQISDKAEKKWRIFQWLTTGFLWGTWLSHDIANIAVFLPRKLDGVSLIFILAVFVGALAYIFYKKGGKIQHIVSEKTNLNYIRTATFIDLMYGFLLLFFKGYNSIPMSTTWVFLGLIAGRELAIYMTDKKYTHKSVIKVIGKDLGKVCIGLIISVIIVVLIKFLA